MTKFHRLVGNRENMGLNLIPNAAGLRLTHFNQYQYRFFEHIAILFSLSAKKLCPSWLVKIDCLYFVFSFMTHGNFPCSVLLQVTKVHFSSQVYSSSTGRTCHTMILLRMGCTRKILYSRDQRVMIVVILVPLNLLEYET